MYVSFLFAACLHPLTLTYHSICSLSTFLLEEFEYFMNSREFLNYEIFVDIVVLFFATVLNCASSCFVSVLAFP